MKTIIALFISICLVTVARSQTDSLGELQGRIIDASSSEGIPFAPVVLLINGTQQGFAQTDDNGNYTIKPIFPGSYDLIVRYPGYISILFQGISITTGMISFRDISMQLSPRSNSNYVNCTPVRSTVVDQNAAVVSTSGSAVGCLSVPGPTQSDNTTSLNNGGSRANETVYYIDGIRLCCGIGLPADRIEDITIITGGIPAKYENANSAINFSVLRECRNSIPTYTPVFHVARVQL